MRCKYWRLVVYCGGETVLLACPGGVQVMAAMADQVDVKDFKKLVSEGKTAAEIGAVYGFNAEWAIKYARLNKVDIRKQFVEGVSQRALVNVDKRIEIVRRLYDHALRNLDRLENIDCNFKTFKGGVQYNLPFIPAVDDMQLMRSITLALKTAVEVEAKSEDSASHAQSSVGSLMASLRHVGKWNL